MLALALFIFFGLLFGYFATLNTSQVTIHLGSFIINEIPLYILVLVSVGIGIVFATIFYMIKSIASYVNVNKKNGELEKSKKEITDLTKTIHKLELENTRLKTKTGEEPIDEDSI
jgi:hypothetical protein